MPSIRAAPPDPREEFLNATDGDENERLELFILKYILPACDNQFRLQEAILSRIEESEKILKYAKAGLMTNVDQYLFSRAFNEIHDLGSSPMPILTIGEMMRAIVGLEKSYANFVSQSDDLAELASVDYRQDEGLNKPWEAWRSSHNALVQEYDKLKSEKRFGKPLYRPQKPSRWGSIIEPSS